MENKLFLGKLNSTRKVKLEVAKPFFACNLCVSPPCHIKANFYQKLASELAIDVTSKGQNYRGSHLIFGHSSTVVTYSYFCSFDTSRPYCRVTQQVLDKKCLKLF